MRSGTANPDSPPLRGLEPHPLAERRQHPALLSARPFPHAPERRLHVERDVGLQLLEQVEEGVGHVERFGRGIVRQLPNGALQGDDDHAAQRGVAQRQALDLLGRQALREELSAQRMANRAARVLREVAERDAPDARVLGVEVGHVAVDGRGAPLHHHRTKAPHAPRIARSHGDDLAGDLRLHGVHREVPVGVDAERGEGGGGRRRARRGIGSRGEAQEDVGPRPHVRVVASRQPQCVAQHRRESRRVARQLDGSHCVAQHLLRLQPADVVEEPGARGEHAHGVALHLQQFGHAPLLVRSGGGRKL